MLAVAQPGDLGREDTAGPAQETTTTAAPTSTTTVAETSTTSTTGVAPTTLPGEPTTTIAGSGLGVSEAPTGGSDGIADTGGESMIGAGMALAALGLVLRRAARTSTA